MRHYPGSICMDIPIYLPLFWLSLFLLHFVNIGKCANDGRIPEHDKNSKRETWLSLRVSEGLLEEMTLSRNPKDELAKGAKSECPNGEKTQEQETAWQCRWYGMTGEGMREAGGRYPDYGRPCQLWRVSTWPPGWLILKGQELQWTNHTQRLAMTPQSIKWEHQSNYDSWRPLNCAITQAIFTKKNRNIRKFSPGSLQRN